MAHRRRPTPLALIDPFADWVDRRLTGEARRGDLRLVVLRAGGVWAYEVYAGDTQIPAKSGAASWWTRDDAKAGAVREADVLLTTSRPAREPRASSDGSRPVALRLLDPQRKGARSARQP